MEGRRERRRFYTKRFHGVCSYLGGVGSPWKESAEVADNFGLMDKFNTFSCIMMSKSGEHFNTYFIGEALA